MVKCAKCNEEIDFPFRCNYCGDLFCAKHRLPEKHNCINLPQQAPYYLRETNSVSFGKNRFNYNAAGIKDKKSKKKLVAVLATLLLIGVFFVFVLDNQAFLTSQTPITSPTSNPSSTNVVSPPQSSGILPDTHQDFVNYALSLINSDRQSKGLHNVSLSNINSAQLHADEMLKNGYFSHWNMNGYKPYMRYTLAGGDGSVSENIAWQSVTGNLFGIDIKSALNDLEYSLMYDDAAWNWGHRDNILEPLHNKVSIGIAYDNHNVYLVQDFEDDYISWSKLTVSGNRIEMQGTLSQSESISQIGIFYDNVSPLTVQQLSNSPYDGSYDSGIHVGTVLPSGWEVTEGITVTASTWMQTSNNFNIAFDFSTAYMTHGKGVYTLLLWTESDSYLTTYSIWK